MRCEWPACKRCCFCIPIRYGLLIWAYIKFIFSLLAIFLSCASSKLTTPNYVFISYFIVESLAHLVLIVGAHMKDYKIIQIYFYYGFVAVSFSVLGLCMLIGYAIFMIVHGFPAGIVAYVMELPVIVQLINIALDVYLLTLVRSELVKLRDNHQFRFVNNAVEADCTVTMDDAHRDGTDLTNGIDHPTVVIEDKNEVERNQQS